ncbi:hypothetical protein GCM10027047_20270 [Rhodococcus aerolatus]
MDAVLLAPLQALFAALLALLVAFFAHLSPTAPVGPTPVPPPTTTTPPPTAAAAAWFGVLGPDPLDPVTLRRDGITRVSLTVGWDAFEPSPGSVSPGYVAGLRTRLARYREAGLDVVLEPGLQYPPSWVFDLPGQTRFVNQFGDVFHGASSQDVANGVFNPAVRAAQQRYLAEIATQLGSSSFVGVRVGGLLSGELRYPLNRYGGHVGSLWGFDPAAAAGSPVPGWRPGTGSADDARRWVQYYLDSLTGYGTALLTTAGAAFPGAGLALMMPSFGLRPGMVDTAVAGGLVGTTAPEVNDLLSQGLDWVGQADAAARTRLPVTLHTTWLDSPDFGTGVSGEAPVRYLAGLASARGLGLSGENTGGGGAAALARCLDQAADLHLAGVLWLGGADLAAGRAGLDLAVLATGLAARAPSAAVAGPGG